VTRDVALNEKTKWGDWTFSISGASLSDACEFTGATTDDGDDLLTVTGEVARTGGSTGQDEPAAAFESLQVETSDSDQVDLTREFDCRSADDGRPSWAALRPSDNPTAFRSVFTAPPDSQFLLVSAGHETWRIPVTPPQPSPSNGAAVADAAPAAPAPTLIECIYGGGSWTGQGQMSDGSFQSVPQCQALRDQQMAANPYRCPRTDHYVPGPEHCAAPHTPPPVETPEQPSPWVQGQIDWANCLEAGNTEEQCREMLNG
jgi:hypothetical protein